MTGGSDRLRTGGPSAREVHRIDTQAKRASQVVFMVEACRIRRMLQVVRNDSHRSNPKNPMSPMARSEPPKVHGRVRRRSCFRSGRRGEPWRSPNRDLPLRCDASDGPFTLRRLGSNRSKSWMILWRQSVMSCWGLVNRWWFARWTGRGC